MKKLILLSIFIFFFGFAQDSLKIKYSKKEKSSTRVDVTPNELEKDQIQILDKVDVTPNEVEKKETPVFNLGAHNRPKRVKKQRKKNKVARKSRKR